MKLIISILLLSATLFGGCKTSDLAYLYDNIEITWKPDKAKENTAPVDSIVVRFEPVYWVEEPCMDGSIEEKEYEFTQDGYDVWMLYNPYARRIEVTKRDTVIYIYRK